MKKAVGIMLILAGFAVVGYWFWQYPPRESPDKVTLYGNIELREVDLAINGSERIAAVHLWEGDRVERGQLLAELKLERFQAQVENLQAQVAAQKARVDKLDAGSRPQEIQRARAELEEAEAQQQIAWLTYRRLQKLLPRKLVSPEEVDQARADAEAATARRQASEETLSLAVEGPRREDIVAAQATLAAYRAQLALARQKLKDARLYAPADGIIRNRILEPGDMASPQRPVYTLALNDPLWARMYVSEPDLGKIKPGMAATLFTDSFPDKSYSGWIGYISPTAEFTPKTVQTEELRTHLVYQVRVYVCNPEGELRLGMPVTVHIPLGDHRTMASELPCRESP
ncbi:MAG: HlyD family efflux transporter periplasmic adaptor subunit [Methylohalobius crimeensis]